MRSFFNLYGLLKRDAISIDLQQELDSRLRRIKVLQKARADQAIGDRMFAHTGGSLGLSLRMDAAVAARIRTMLNAGRTSMTIRSNQSVDHALLGGQATSFRIYDRNVERDLKQAFTSP